MPDNIESRMNFIIEQQAQFAADIQLLKERETEIFRMIHQLTDVSLSLARHSEATDQQIQRLIESQGRIIESQAHSDRRLDALIDVVESQADSDKRLDQHIQQLIESQAHTDRRLDALINVVDKLARRNGP